MKKFNQYDIYETILLIIKLKDCRPTVIISLYGLTENKTIERIRISMFDRSLSLTKFNADTFKQIANYDLDADDKTEINECLNSNFSNYKFYTDFNGWVNLYEYLDEIRGDN